MSEALVAVITPTKRYGGLAEQFYNLLDQTYEIDAWIIADDLYEQRKDIVAEKTYGAPFGIYHYQPAPKPEGYWSNLAGIYNEMFDKCQDLGADVVLSIQDYIMLRLDGVQMMVEDVLNTESLVTGLVSYGDEPGIADIEDWEGLWTLFEEPYQGIPTSAYWEDVRGTSGVYKPNLLQHTGIKASSVGSIVDWELNWAGIPGYVSDYIRLDPKYGEGIGYENQDLAWQVYLEHDKTPYINTTNHAWSLPHQLYFPEERAEYKHFSEMNRERHHRKYQQPEVEL